MSTFIIKSRIPAIDMADFNAELDADFVAPTTIVRIAMCMDCGIDPKWMGLDICVNCYDKRNPDWD